MGSSAESWSNAANLPTGFALHHNLGLYKEHCNVSWWRGTVVERRSLAGELSLSCARPAADG